VQPLVSNPWTVLHAGAPAKDEYKGPAVVDLDGALEPAPRPERRRRRDVEHVRDEAAWRGILLPKTDADVWLAAAFAEYEPIFAAEHRARGQAKDGKLGTEERERTAVALYGHRSRYLAAVRASADVPLSKIRAQVDRDEWYRIASGKGVLLLHELRKKLGDGKFADMMDAFGRDHGGKEVATAQFQAHVAKWANGAGADTAALLEQWLTQPGLPEHKPEAQAKGTDKPGVPGRDLPPDLPPNPDKPEAPATGPHKPEAQARGTGQGVFSVRSFHHDLERTLIVYGTPDEVPSNREAALALQEAIRQGPNVTVPIKADRDVTDVDLKEHHLLLIGRPDSNRCVARFRAALPITFGSRSFTVGKECYAHANSAVLAAAANPLNPRYSLVAVAGLDAASTLRAAPVLANAEGHEAEVVVLANGERPRNLVVSVTGD
jgi:hypothetical protein